MGESRETYEAFVTLATNDTYALGCLVLGNSLRRVNTTRQLVVMVTQGVSPSVRNQLSGVFDQTVLVNILDSNDASNLELLGRPDLSVTFTKIHCWRLTQFKKCVFMDADTLVVQNIDELFDREELSAAPDPGWPDCFNSGVFVYVPSEETYRSLLSFAVTSQSFDGGDQGLLNLFFKGWATEDIGKHLPFIYNVVSQAFYSYLPAFKQFRGTIKVVHFIGPVKPWHHTYSASTRTVRELPDTGHSLDFLQLWWDIFMDNVQPSLDPQLGGIAGELAHISLQGDAVDKDDRERKLQWEQGHADYMGVDRFDNIKARLDEKIAEPTPSGSRSSLNQEEETKPEVRPSPGAGHTAGPPPQDVGAVSVASVPSGQADSDRSLSSQADIVRVAESGADVTVQSVGVEDSSQFPQSTIKDSPSVEDTKVASPPLSAAAQTPQSVDQDTAEIFIASAPVSPSQQSTGLPVVDSSGQTSQPILQSPVSDSTPAVGQSVATSSSSASSRTVGKSVVTAGSTTSAAASAVGKSGGASSPSSVTTLAVGKPGVASSTPTPATTSAVGKPGVASSSPTPATTSAVGKPGVVSSTPTPATTSAIGKTGVASSTATPAAASKPENQQTAQPTSEAQPKVSEPIPTGLSPSPAPTPVTATDRSVPFAENVPSRSQTSRPESLITKPAPRSGADPSKSSFVSGLASKFANPSPTSPVASPSKPTSSFSQLASRFDTAGGAKPQALGATARTPTGAAASQKATEASASPSKTSGQSSFTK